MNTEIRDHAIFLKGALDLITNSTTADTGNTVQLWVKRAAVGSIAYSASVTADTNNRFQIAANGTTAWGSGSAVADTNLYRDAVDSLKTDDSFTAAGTLRAESSAVIGTGTTLTGALGFTERAGSGNAGTNEAWLFAKDNGSGKTQLVVVFQSGNTQIIATEP